MLTIAFTLLGAWILNWFGFSNLIAYGADKFFGVEVTTTGYYFLFAMLGVVKIILNHIRLINVTKRED